MSGLKRSTYYYTCNKTNRDEKNDEIMNRIIEIYYHHKQRYGYRRIALELNKQGAVVNHKKSEAVDEHHGAIRSHTED